MGSSQSTVKTVELLMFKMTLTTVLVLLVLCGCVMSYTGHENCEKHGGSNRRSHLTRGSRSRASGGSRLPYHLGCFDVNLGQEIPHLISDVMTHDLCANTCGQISARFPALKTGTDCYCLRDITGAMQVPSGQCDIRCPGDNLFFCGGQFTLDILYIG